MIRVTLSKESLNVRVRTMHVELGKKELGTTSEVQKNILNKELKLLII